MLARGGERLADVAPPSVRGRCRSSPMSRSGQRACRVRKIAARFGHLDVLINNAAVYRPCAVELLSDADIERQVATNFLGCVYTCRAPFHCCERQVGRHREHSSESTLHPFPMLSMYVATKAALEAFGRVLAQEVQDDDIRVTTLVQGTAKDAATAPRTGRGIPSTPRGLRDVDRTRSAVRSPRRYGDRTSKAIGDVHVFIVTRPRTQKLDTVHCRSSDRTGEHMTGFDAFRYDGKRVLVVGGRPDGRAAAQTVAALGAEVVVMDYAPVDYQVKDHSRSTWRARRHRRRPRPDRGPGARGVLAPVSRTHSGIMKINFIAHRHIIDRLIAGGALSRGGAICMISSVAGSDGKADAHAHRVPRPHRTTSRRTRGTGARRNRQLHVQQQAINCYVARQSYPLLSKGIRITRSVLVRPIHRWRAPTPTCGCPSHRTTAMPREPRT